jgi:hypothetical protein
VEVAPDLTAALAATLRRFADWHATPDIEIERSDPPELARELKAYF